MIKVMPWALGFFVSTVFAGTLSFLKDSPIGQFKEADIELLKNSVSAVLEEDDAGSAREWKNTATGNSGRVELRATFKTADGMHCKTLRVINRSKSLESEATYRLCKDPDGNWQLDEAAKPAPK